MIFLLAPMDDVTDTVFRRMVAECAEPDYSMTEFVNVDGLCSPGRPKLMRKLDASLDAAPVIAQIWGKKPENFRQIASEIVDGTIPGFVGIDLNFGCPAKSEVKAGCCSAMQQLELRPDAAAIIEATLDGANYHCPKCARTDLAQKGEVANRGELSNECALGQTLRKITMPVSFKTRLGFREIDYTWHEFLLGYKPWMLTVHVRTTKEMSKVPARWEAIRPILDLRDRISPDTKIIMNGDIVDREHGEKIVNEYGVDGVMIGRGIFHNPFCFAENAEEVWSGKSREERLDLLKRQIELHIERYPNGERPFNPLKKFAKVYISEFPGASELRAQIMDTTNAEEALELVIESRTAAVN